MAIRRLGRNSSFQRICGNTTAYLSGSGGFPATPGNGYEYQVFTSPGTFSVSGKNFYDSNSKVIKTTTSFSNVEVLVIGGGGGANSAGASAGGGAGGLAYSPSYPVTSPVPISTGTGGPSPSSTSSRGAPGNPSYFGSITGNGGGGGGSIGANSGNSASFGPGDPGGCGGGGTGWWDPVNSGGPASQPSNPSLGGLVSNFGFGGGTSGRSPWYSAAGGGGTGAAGSSVATPYSGPAPSGYSTPGGGGRFYPQFSSPLISATIPSPERTNWSSAVSDTGVYASGGSAGSSGPGYSAQPYPVAAAIGGGGGGASGSAGQNYTGGGCGGANNPPNISGPKGGDGIVIVRYAIAIDHGDGTSQNPIKDGVGLNAIASSGNYFIKTPAMGNALQAYVDTSTGDGKWIRVFLANTNNYNTTSFSWDDVQIPNLITNSNKFMYCFVNTSTNATSLAWSWWFYSGTSESNYTAFRDNPPLSHGGDGSPLITRINARQISSMTDYLGYYLRTGISSFGSACDDSRSGTYGQICLKGSNTSSSTGTGGLSNFPHYAAFSHSNSDYCSESSQGYTTSSCSDTRRFAIYVQL